MKITDGNRAAIAAIQQEIMGKFLELTVLVGGSSNDGAQPSRGHADREMVSPKELAEMWGGQNRYHKDPGSEMHEQRLLQIRSHLKNSRVAAWFEFRFARLGYGEIERAGRSDFGG